MIVAVGGWRGTGCTTTALVLAHVLAADAGAAWLVEADPAGGVLAGRLEPPAHTVGGLERVAYPLERTTAAEAFRSVAAAFGPLRVVTAPLDPFRAHACHQPRLPWVTALRELDAPVVVDVGRLRAGTPAWSVLAHADHVLVCTSAEVAAVVSTAEWLRAGGRVSPTDAGLADGTARVVVVNSPGSVAFTRTTLQADLGSGLGGWLPWEPGAVDLLHRGATPADRRLRSSKYVGAARALALQLRPVALTEAVTEGGVAS